jgi:RNA recognition motif-containing protein
MECSICNHTWFQSRDRLATLGEGFEMISLPERDMDRIQLNMKEGRHPKHFGDYKMYVGNISFQCTEADVIEVFETVGPVGDVSLVRDDMGRIRGFGFVTMRNKADGEKALEKLDGTELKGRKLNVRPSTN